MKNITGLTHALLFNRKRKKKKSKQKHYENCVWMLQNRTEVNAMAESVLEKFQNVCGVFCLVDCCVGFVGLLVFIDLCCQLLIQHLKLSLCTAQFGKGYLMK